jgi:hypothetical protein
LLFRFKKKLEGNTRTFRSYHRKEILNLFMSNGFGREKSVRQFFWPVVVHRKLPSRRACEVLEAVPRFLGLQELVGSTGVLRVERLSPVDLSERAAL